MSELNYEHVFNVLVDKTAEYVTSNNLKAMSVYRLERSYRAALFDACADAGDVNMANSYYLDELEEMPSRTPIANGNLQARCRMMYLYDIASRHKGLVMSTDNQTEYQLGFWTIHGDCWSQLCARHGEDVVNKVWSRHLASEFKRKKAPIYISRELYE